MNTREQDIEALVTPVIEALGCELWGVEFMSMGRHSKLRIYIERPEGVSRRLDQCLLCGSCAANCPSGVKVSNDLHRAHWLSLF